MNNNELSNKFILYNTLLVSGIALFSPILYIFLISSGYSYTEAGTYLSIFWGVSAITELPTGIIADTIGQKFTVVISSFLRAIGLIILLMDGFIFLIISAILTGIAESMMSGTLSSWLMNQTKDKEALNLDEVFSRAAFYGSVFSLIIGFLIAQYIFPYNSSFPILASSIFFALMGIIIFKNLPEKKEKNDNTERKLSSINKEWKETIHKIIELFTKQKTVFFVILFLIFPTILDIGPSNQWQIAFNNNTSEYILGYLWIMISFVGVIVNLFLPKLPRFKNNILDILFYVILDIVIILLMTLTSFNIIFFLVHIAIFTVLSVRINVYIHGTLVKNDRIRSSIVSTFYTLEALITTLLLPINGYYSEMLGIFNTWNLFIGITIILLSINTVILYIIKRKQQLLL